MTINRNDPARLFSLAEDYGLTDKLEENFFEPGYGVSTLKNSNACDKLSRRFGRSSHSVAKGICVLLTQIRRFLTATNPEGRFRSDNNNIKEDDIKKSFNETVENTVTAIDVLKKLATATPLEEQVKEDAITFSIACIQTRLDELDETHHFKHLYTETDNPLKNLLTKTVLSNSR